MDNFYIIASSKPWNKGLSDALHAATGHRFQLISDPVDLSAAHLAELNPRLIFFPHWSHRIPAAVYENFECVIFHMTDLPYGRGGSPLQNLIARGICETQITALKCIEEIDAGPVYLKRPLSLYGAAEEIYIRASKVIEEMVVEIINSTPQPKAQVGKPTLFRRRTPDDGSLLHAGTLDQVFDLIRMLDADGYPRAFINVGKMRFEFTRASRQAHCIVADVKITLQDTNMEEIK